MSEEPIKLPDLHEHILDDSTLDQLLLDIEALTEVIEVQVKGGANIHAKGGTVELGLVKDLLMSGQARGVQIRYVHGDQQWWDTLMRTAEGIRLVRIKAPEV